MDGDFFKLNLTWADFFISAGINSIKMFRMHRHRPGSTKSKGAYQSAWITLLICTLPVLAGLVIGFSTVEKSRKLRIVAQGFKNLPPLDFRGHIDRAVLLNSNVLVSQDLTWSAGYDPRSIDLESSIEDFETGQKSIQRYAHKGDQVEFDARVSDKEKRISIGPVFNGEIPTLPAEIHFVRRFSVRCAYPQDPTYTFKQAYLRTHTNGGLSLTANSFYVGGIPDLRGKANLAPPVKVSSSVPLIAQSYTSTSTEVTFELDIPSSDKHARAFAGEYIESSGSGSTSGEIACEKPDILEMTDEVGSTQRFSSVLFANLNVKALNSLKIDLLPGKANKVQLECEGTFRSIRIGEVELLPSFLEETFTTNRRFSSAGVAIFVALTFILLMIVQRCLSIILDTHLPKPKD